MWILSSHCSISYYFAFNCFCFSLTSIYLSLQSFFCFNWSYFIRWIICSNVLVYIRAYYCLIDRAPNYFFLLYIFYLAVYEFYAWFLSLSLIYSIYFFITFIPVDCILIFFAILSYYFLKDSKYCEVIYFSSIFSADFTLWR